MIIKHTIFETDFGWTALQGNHLGIIRSSLPLSSKRSCEQEVSSWNAESNYDEGAFIELQHRLQSYFSGCREDFQDVKLNLHGSSPFYKRAWIACRSIPSGETRTYKWLSERAGSPGAARAAGQAMAKNQFPILVPCHRVLGSNGNLTGFGAESKQLELKEKLLTMERKTNLNL